MKRCEAITASGTQCSRSATQAGLCTQHGKCKDTPIKVTIKEPWTALQLKAPDARNGSRTLQKIRSLLTRGPSAKDEASSGTIYVYFLDHEAGLNLYKIGRTERPVDDRLEEWATEHNEMVTKQAAYEVVRNLDYIERVIHLYLKWANVYRYVQEDGTLYSEFSMSGDPVFEKHKDKHLNATRKFIEWFQVPWPVIESLLRTLVPTLQLLRPRKQGRQVV